MAHLVEHARLRLFELLPDYDAYDYAGRELRPVAGMAGIPVFTCQADASTPIPEALPHVAWRAGLDLNPLDVTDADQMAGLETLAWPGQEQRLARLRAAVEVAQAAPPGVMGGDLRQGLATLAYVPGQAGREDSRRPSRRCATSRSPMDLPACFQPSRRERRMMGNAGASCYPLMGRR